MEPLLRPVGPASPATYWRRRAIVLAIVVLVSYLLVRTCSASGPGDGVPLANQAPTTASTTATGGGTSGETETGAPGEPTAPTEPSGAQTGPGGTSPETAGAGESQAPGIAEVSAGGGGGIRPGYCVDDNVRLDVRPDDRSYATGKKPVFALSFFNVGEGPCKLEIGPVGWTIDVQSGNEHIWSTDDCGQDENSDVVTLQRLTPVTVKVTWDRARSKPGCPTGLGGASPGTYTVSASAGEINAPKAVFVLEPAT